MKGLLERWAQGESQLGAPAAVARSAQGLPPRLGWLLRALEALDDGRISSVESCAEQAEDAGQGEVAAVLRLLLMPRADVQPTALRKAAKAQGLGKGWKLPFCDLYRALATWRAGVLKARVSALSQASRGRPVLDGASVVLSKRKWHAHYYHHCLSERAALFITLSGFVIQYGIARAPLAYARREGVSLSRDPARWRPDNGGLLERWLAEGGPWTEAHIAATEAPNSLQPRQLLPALIRGLQRELLAGRAMTVASLCFSISSLSPHMSPAASEQFDEMFLGLGVVLDVPALQIHLAQRLWRTRKDLSAAERLVVARTALVDIDDDDDDEEYDDVFEPQIFVQMVSYLLAHEPDASVALSLLECYHYVFGVGELSELLQRHRASPERRCLLRGWLAVHNDAPTKGLDDVRQLTRFQVSDALVFELLSALLQLRDPDSAAPRLKRKAEAALAAFAKRRPSVEVWCALLTCGGWSYPRPAILEAIAEARSVPELSQGFRCAQHLQLPEVAADCVRRLGRVLRRTRDDEIRRRMVLFFLGEVCGRDATNLVKLLIPLTRFALRHGSQRLADSLAGSQADDLLSPDQLAGIAAWMVAHADQLPEQRWRMLCGEVCGDKAPDEIDAALAAGHRTLDGIEWHLPPGRQQAPRYEHPDQFDLPF